MSRQSAFICGLLLLAVGLIFGQTIGHDFINLDDEVCVYDNPQISHGLSAQTVVWIFTQRLAGNWDPLTWISHILDWQLYGPSAGGHHLTNLLLHAATTLLLFLALRQMTGSPWPSALAAALWAIHPLRVESVAWVTERKDVLSGAFFMLSIGAYASYVRHRSLARYLAVMILFALGLMSKPMLVTLPCVLLLLDYWPLGRMARRETHSSASAASPGFLILEKLPLAALVAVCCAVTFWAQRVAELNYGSLYSRLGNASISYLVYLRQFFWPADLAFLYPRRGPDLPPWQVFGAGMVLLSISAAVWAFRRRCPYLLVGWLWYLGVMLPVVGLVPFGEDIAADRFTYLPQIGLCVAVAWGAADLCRSWPYRRLVYGAGAVLAFVPLAWCAWQQTSYWRDSDTICGRALACTTGNYRVYVLLGNTLAKRGLTDEAIAQFQKALKINPDFAAAHYSLGVAAAGLGRMDEATACYRRAIAAKPDFAAAHNNLGNALLVRGQIDEAIVHCSEALRIRPDFAEAYYNLGNALFMLGRLGEAMTQYEKALEFRPDYAEAYYNLGLALEARGRRNDAVAQYRKAQQFAEARASREKAVRTLGR